MKILGEIRDQIRQTNTRLDQHISETHQGFMDLQKALAGSETRTATALTSVAGTLTDIKQLLSDRLDIRDRVEHCEREIEVIKAKLAG